MHYKTPQAHERSLDTDILFGLVRRLQPKRPELKVVVMSATLDVDLFRRFFRVRERKSNAKSRLCSLWNKNTNIA